MSIKIREWYHHYESHDHQLDQLFGLMLGSTLTTLPFFIIMPIGAIIIYNVAVVDKNDRPFGYWPYIEYVLNKDEEHGSYTILE